MSWVEPLVQAGQLTKEDLPAVRDGLLQMHAWWRYFSLDRSAISRAHQQWTCSYAKKCHADPPQWFITVIIHARSSCSRMVPIPVYHSHIYCNGRQPCRRQTSCFGPEGLPRSGSGGRCSWTARRPCLSSRSRAAHY